MDTLPIEQLHKNALALSYGTDLNVSCVYDGFDDTQLRRHIQRTRCDMVIGTVARIQAYIEQRVVNDHSIMPTILYYRNIYTNAYYYISNICI